MYTDEELKNILLDAVGSHQSLDHKLHLMEAVTKLFDKAERYEKALDDIKNLSTLNEYADANINGLLNACFEKANNVRPYKF